METRNGAMVACDADAFTPRECLNPRQVEHDGDVTIRLPCARPGCPKGIKTRWLYTVRLPKVRLGFSETSAADLSELMVTQVEWARERLGPSVWQWVEQVRVPSDFFKPVG